MREGTRMKRAILLTTSSLAAIAAALATIALLLVASGNPAVAASSLVNGDFETTKSGGDGRGGTRCCSPFLQETCEGQSAEVTPEEGCYCGGLRPLGGG